MAPNTRTQHVSFSAYTDTSDLDISIIYFHPEEILLPLSSISSSRLPSSAWPTTDSHEDTLILQPLSPHLTSNDRPATRFRSSNSAVDSVRFVDVTLSSPIMLTSFPKDSHKSSLVEFSQVEPIEKPRPLYIRPKQSNKRPDLPSLAIPPATGLGFTKVQAPAQAKLVDLVEPRTRFTQMLGPNIVFESPSAKAYAASLNSDVREYSYFSPVHRSNPAEPTLSSIASTMTSFRDWLVRVCKYQTDQQHIEWEMLDEEAIIENKAHRDRVDELLKEIDEQVEEQGGIPFMRPEAVEETPPRVTMASDRGTFLPFEDVLRLMMEERSRKRAEKQRRQRVAKGECACGALNEKYCVPECRMMRAARRRKEAQRREVRRVKWSSRKRSAVETGKELFKLVFVWPAELVSWIGEHRTLSWILVAMMVALLILGMVMAVGRLVEG